MAAVAAPTAVAVPAAAAAAATTTAATATATTTIGATIVKATTTTTTTLVGKLIGRLQNRTAELTEEDVDGRQGRGRGSSDSDSDSDSDSGVVGSSTPASYLSLYDEVASALDETQAEAEAEAEEAGYALIDDISEWLLSGVGGSSNSTLTPTSVSSSSSSSNETLTWLTLDTDTNTNTDEMQLQNTTLSLGPLSSGNSSDADGGGLYALRNFVEQQLNGGEASQDAEDIALIDSAEESALETVGDGETDYGGILGGFSYLDVATNELLQHTATRITNRTTVDADALWLSGAAAHTPNAAGGGAGGAGGVGTGTGTGAGTGGSSFMLLLENFNDYFPNYNGSTISGTTTASNILLDQNLTTLYIENYRTNCTNGTLNFTAESCPDLRVVDHNYWALILILFPILTLFGNILVILSVCRERSLQTVTNYFIVSLAIADLLVAVVVMPFAVYFLGRLSL